jgi:predicted secreted acid phosphatase
LPAIFNNAKVRMDRMAASTLLPLDQFEGVVFDLDGTLLDTLTDIANAANAVLAQHGFPPHPVASYRESGPASRQPG